jgi:hypothetical protein
MLEIGAGEISFSKCYSPWRLRQAFVRHSFGLVSAHYGGSGEPASRYGLRTAVRYIT